MSAPNDITSERTIESHQLLGTAINSTYKEIYSTYLEKQRELTSAFKHLMKLEPNLDSVNKEYYDIMWNAGFGRIKCLYVYKRGPKRGQKCDEMFCGKHHKE